VFPGIDVYQHYVQKTFKKLTTHVLNKNWANHRRITPLANIYTPQIGTGAKSMAFISVVSTYLYKWQYGNIILIDFIKCFIKNASLMIDKVNGDQHCEF
jgi:hypothetical protein